MRLVLKALISMTLDIKAFGLENRGSIIKVKEGAIYSQN
jgi:hypothetical protein